MKMEAYFKLGRFSSNLVTILLTTVALGLSQQAHAASCLPAPKINLTVIEEFSNFNQGQEFTTRKETKIKNGQVRQCSESNLFDLIDPQGNSIADLIGSRNDSTDKRRSCIIISANGDHIYLMPQMHGPGSGSYMKRSASDIKRQRESMMPPELNSEIQKIVLSQTPSSLTKTDHTRVIDSRKAVLHVGNSADGKTRFEFWVTTDIKDTDFVKQAKECADRQFDYTSIMDTIYKNKLPGIVLESLSIIDGKETSRYRWISISRDLIPDKEFQIPAGYRSMEDIRKQQVQGGGDPGVPWFPGMPDIPGVPVQR